MLSHSLRIHASRYPLVVAINPALPAEARRVIEAWGLDVRVVEPIKPVGAVTYIAQRFEDTWTKLTVFDFDEFDVSGWSSISFASPPSGLETIRIYGSIAR